MIPDGNELVIDRIAADYWRSLYALALALVLYFRVARPLARAARFDLRVTEVIEEAPGVVSLRIGGRGLDRLGAQAGQFFFWRFLTRGFWYTKHPFSLSEAPERRLVPDHRQEPRRPQLEARDRSRSEHASSPKAHSVSSPPRARSSRKTLLIAGGIGITPVRALLEQIDGDLVALYRVASSSDIVFADELDRIAADRAARASNTWSATTRRRSTARPPLADPPRGARPRHRRTRRLHLRPARHDRQHRPQPAPGSRPPPPPPRRAVRPLTEWRPPSVPPLDSRDVRLRLPAAAARGAPRGRRHRGALPRPVGGSRVPDRRRAARAELRAAALRARVGHRRLLPARRGARVRAAADVRDVRPPRGSPTARCWS